MSELVNAKTRKPRYRINVAALVGGRTADSAADTPSARQGAIGPQGQSRR